jgi:DNA (cytosine-5)-methyltransferase 1
MSDSPIKTFYEFFAGGGMARMGLGPGWQCVLANDFDRKKAESYQANWGDSEFVLKDVAKIGLEQLPGQADLAWASFPCQDLSLAGDYLGLAGERSGTFWPFWDLMRKLAAEGRAPRTIVVENVYGALTSHSGEDFKAIASAFSHAGYQFGALVIDARLFVPQSRPRLFLIGVRADIPIPSWLKSTKPNDEWHPRAVRDAYARLSSAARSRWVWWSLPLPAKRQQNFVDIIEPDPTGVKWHTTEETAYLISLMSPVNRHKLEKAVEITSAIGGRIVGGVYRRTRQGQQRAEVRFDDVAGCLRTPAGGSSRQSIMLVEQGKVRSRLLSPREAARLMGLPDTYILPQNYNAAPDISSVAAE